MPSRRAALSAATQQKLRDAVRNGRAAEAYRGSQGRYILLEGGSKTRLLEADGTATAAGRFYYGSILGVAPPTL